MNSIKKILISTVFLISFVGLGQENVLEKSDLKILYIGQHPDQPEGYTYGGNYKANAERNKWRANDFMQLLNTYFNEVTLVYGHEYLEPMSDNYDVTIFDALTTKIKDKEYGIHEESGREIVVKKAEYLTKNFDAASLLIAGIPAALIPNRKSKLKWLCHCLREHAFGMDPNHEVFNKPFKVAIVEEKVATPNPFYGYYSGRELDDTMQMMRIQNTDAPKNYASGFVSFPGLADSPDAEMISNGTNIKSVNSAAIARHGNFYQWGFRAPPKYMTEAGKLIFINSIHYIAKFKGKKPYVKWEKSFRLSALDLAYKVSDIGFNRRIEFVLRVNDMLDSAKARVASGKGNASDKGIIRRPYSKIRRFDLLKKIPQELINSYADDWNGYLDYYKKNIGYIYAGEKYMEFFIDEDAQSLGIANNDLKMLEMCIEMLLNNDRVELAQRLLLRYTNQNFDSPRKWKKWFKKNKDHLFFSDTGGYKFMEAQ